MVCHAPCCRKYKLNTQKLQRYYYYVIKRHNLLSISLHWELNWNRQASDFENIMSALIWRWCEIYVCITNIGGTMDFIDYVRYAYSIQTLPVLPNKARKKITHSVFVYVMCSVRNASHWNFFHWLCWARKTYIRPYACILCQVMFNVPLKWYKSVARKIL